MFKKIISLFLLSLAGVVLAACGASSPSTSSAGGAAPTIKSGTAITMAVNFPIRNVMPNALISASTNTLNITITDSANPALTVGSGTITAPVVGGTASTTIYLNVSTSYAGPIDIDVISKDNLTNLLGDVKLSSKTVVPQVNNSFAVTLAEKGQGMLIASGPVLTAPDGSTYQITKVFLSLGNLTATWPMTYDLGIEANVTPVAASSSYIAQSYASTYAIPITTSIFNGLASWNVPVAVPNNPASFNVYTLTLNFNDLTNNPTLTGAILVNTASASITGLPRTNAWSNNVGPSTIASTGVTVIVN